MKKNKLKNISAYVSAFLISLFFNLYAETDASDLKIFSDIVTSYAGAAYPSVIQQADTLTAEYPDSAFYHKALLYKGESLCFLGRFAEAETALYKAACSDDNDVQVLSYYWLGKSRLAQKKNNEALEAFYKCCEISKSRKISKKSEHYYNMALFNAGETYFISEDYKKAIPVFESVISRGNEYPADAYSESFIMLFKSYLEEKKYSSLTSLYKKTPEMKGELSETYAQLSLLASNAYEKTGDYKNSWNCCTKALLSADEKTSSEAFIAAYRISVPYEKQTGTSTADFFKNITHKISANPEVLAETWIRIATDAFEKGDFENAETYFNNAETFDAEKKYASLISLYRAKIKGNTLELMGSVESDNELYSAYEAAFAEQYASVGDWSNCYVHGKNAYENIESGKDENLKRKSAFFYAVGLLNCGQIKEAENIIEKGKVPFKSGEPFYESSRKLLARIYAVSGREEKAIELYKGLELNAEESTDYAKVLFSCGYLSSSKKEGLKSNTMEGKYIAALSCFNLKEWNEAETLFSDYLKSNKKSNREYAVFYLGYCQYKLGKISACQTLENFSTNYAGHPLCYNAAVICANAMVTAGKIDEAIKQSCLALSLAKNETEKENAVLLTAALYEDSGNKESAIAVLAPYAKQSSDFGIRCKYKTALLYAGAGKLNEADKLFYEITQKHSASKFAEESCYRRAELFYSAGKYENAVKRFEDYKNLYPKGNFYEIVLFYSADSKKNLKKTSDAILAYELLLAEYPASTYAYSALRNLAALYKDSGNMPKVKECCSRMLACAMNEGQKAEARKLSESLTASTDSNSKKVSLQKNYEKLGKQKTLEGRIAGTELVKFIWAQEKYSDAAVELAETLYAEQCKKANIEAECLYAAQNAVILAESERNKKQYESSAQLFLSAAKYGRMAGNTALASRSLYGAAEAFYTDGKKGDAESVAKNLMELYGDTEYAKSVRQFINR